MATADPKPEAGALCVTFRQADGPELEAFGNWLEATRAGHPQLALHWRRRLADFGVSVGQIAGRRVGGRR